MSHRRVILYDGAGAPVRIYFGSGPQIALNVGPSDTIREAPPSVELPDQSPAPGTLPVLTYPELTL